MFADDISDTIAAIATGVGESGIGIVRLSGKEAFAIADRIFSSKDGKLPSKFKTYTVHYGWVIDHRPSLPVRQAGTIDHRPNIVDEVLLTVMRAPRSYTKEDIVEVNCHGGIVALRRVLDLVLDNGARLAEPGEFTKRAFLNGRIDLSQAEAVLDIIRAKSDSALRVGLEQLKGGLSQKIKQIRIGLINILSVLEANIDFPEEGLEEINRAQLRARAEGIEKEIEALLARAKFGKILREGLHVVICGRPNVGKSSLLNALLKQERSIVTAVPGTTRDTIEEIIDIKGIPIRIVDTAGLLEPRDLIEKKAVQRSQQQIKIADLAILLFDANQKLHKDDKILIKRLKNKTILAVINKIDLPVRIEKDYILSHCKQVVEISAKKAKNINLLEEKIADLVFSGKFDTFAPPLAGLSIPSLALGIFGEDTEAKPKYNPERSRRIVFPESLLVSNLRHILILQKAQKLIAGAADSLDNNLGLELPAQDIKDAVGFLDELLGTRCSEDCLDRIFSQFCIGK